MTYKIIKDPYCTGDKWYKEYDLIEGQNDSQEILQYLMKKSYDIIPDSLEYAVDGDDGFVEFTICPKDMLLEEDIKTFLRYAEVEE
jgi:hypothetical protein